MVAFLIPFYFSFDGICLWTHTQRNQFFFFQHVSTSVELVCEDDVHVRSRAHDWSSFSCWIVQSQMNHLIELLFPTPFQ